MLRSQSGDALTMVLMVVAVVAIFVVISSFLMERFQRSSARADSVSTGRQISQILDALASSGTLCDQALTRAGGSVVLAPNPGSTPIANNMEGQIDVISVPGFDVITAETTTDINSRYGFGTVINEIWFRETNQAARELNFYIDGNFYNKYSGVISVQFGSLFGFGGTIEERYPITVATDPGTNQIRLCTGQGSPRNVCNSVGGELDAQGRCVPRPSLDMPSANCPGACPANPDSCPVLYYISRFQDFAPICACAINCQPP